MTARRQRMLGDASVRDCLAIEIGALHSPLLSPDEGRVVRVDYAPTEVLRANLRHPGVDPADVVPVDVVWGTIPLRDAIGEAAGVILASHVIEHVPDLLGWFLELHAALRPGGILGLAIPDRRATFDAWRNDSCIASVVGAHLEKRRRPSAAQLFESATHSDSAAPGLMWRAETGAPLPDPVLERLGSVYRWLQARPESAPYRDAHCWVFTPHSFLNIIEGLAAIGCFPFVVEAFFPTEPGEIEFQLRLCAVREGDPEVRSSITRARATLPPPQLEIRLLQEQLDALHRSTSWRLTRPLRALSRKFASIRKRVPV